VLCGNDGEPSDTHLIADLDRRIVAPHVEGCVVIHEDTFAESDLLRNPNKNTSADGGASPAPLKKDRVKERASGKAE
jgi:hypothetical protein